MTSSLVGSEMCIRDRQLEEQESSHCEDGPTKVLEALMLLLVFSLKRCACLLYTSDAADDM
eukprot:12478555-Prorocentrum_lima.AAC.1